MFKRLLISFVAIIGFSYVTAQKCFVNMDIVNSQTLFTYQGNVYDITNYNHPGGMNTLKQTVGQALETFVNQNKYDFHLTSGKFTRDMQNIYVGVLKDTCTPPTVPTIPPTDPPTIPTNPPTVPTNPPTIPTVPTDTPTIPTVIPTDTTTVPPTETSTVPTVIPVDTTAVIPTTVVPTIPVTNNCSLFSFNSLVPYNQQNMVAEVNMNNIIQDNIYINLGLTQDIGGARLATTQYFQYGKVDAMIKASKGLNVVTGFYIEADNGDIVNFNIIQNQENKNSIIETNFYYNGNFIYDVNAQYHETPIVLYETFNKFSIVWFPTYYEWRLNDVLLRTLNVNDTTTFPNSPSRAKVSIWGGPVSVWAGTGIQWIQGPFSSVISSLTVNCNSATNYSYARQSNNLTLQGIPNSAIVLKVSFSVYLIMLSMIFIFYL